MRQHWGYWVCATYAFGDVGRAVFVARGLAVLTSEVATCVFRAVQGRWARCQPTVCYGHVPSDVHAHLRHPINGPMRHGTGTGRGLGPGPVTAKHEAMRRKGFFLNISRKA